MGQGQATETQTRAASKLERESPLLSVVIACKNGEQYVGRQLEALACQEAAFAWELVFVDNRSTDRSVEVASAYRDRIALRVIAAPQRANRAYARNVGVGAARADKLVFLDADDEVAPGFLTAMFAALQTQDFVGSPSEKYSLNPEWSREAHSTSESSHGVFAPFTGAAVGVSRRVIESVGGWPEQYVPCEDMAFSFQLQRAGVALTFLSEPLLQYRLRTSIRALFAQTRAWGRAQALVHRDFGPAFVPRRSASLALAEWLGVLRELLRARSKADLGRFAVRLGYSVGRLQGSLRHRVFYL
jgi:glycosyltransferase involved in cell wall biosynthesis